MSLFKKIIYSLGIIYHTQPATCAEQELIDTPIINQELLIYYNDKISTKPVRIDISVKSATGAGETVLDFFIADESHPIPITLRDIFSLSPFIQSATETLFESYPVLAITETIGFINEKGKTSGFIGLRKEDFKK